MGPAQFPLDGVVHQHPVHPRLLGGKADQRGVRGTPAAGLHASLVRQHQGGHRQILARRGRQVGLGREVEPDIHI
jgi:hypothetical protein